MFYIEDYQKHTDKYFLRAKEILHWENINPLVRYQAFARKDIKSLIGVDEAVDFIKQLSPHSKIYSLKNGDSYTACEPIMKIEGRVQDLIDLETVYLSILSGILTGEVDCDEIRKEARAIVQVVESKPVFYFGARHFSPLFDEIIAKICQEEGFAGCSTDIGAKAWGTKGLGTIPHSLILTYKAHLDETQQQKNPTVEALKGFDKWMRYQIPRVVLIDTFGREITDSIESAKAVPFLFGVRIDTCGTSLAQGAEEQNIPHFQFPDKYMGGRGVTIRAVWALRRGLDEAGFGCLKIMVSSGFNADKVKAFMVADDSYRRNCKKPLFDSIGTGSVGRPVMTTSDIVAYYSDRLREWVPCAKVGREEMFTNRLVDR